MPITSDHAPIITAADYTATRRQNIAANTLFGVSDADGDAITAYQFWDSTADASSGSWIVGGVPQPAGQAIDVTLGQLATTSFQTASGTDHVWVRASDGVLWSDWKDFYINAPVDHPPLATASDYTATRVQVIAATSLFHVSDADGDIITQYQLWDSTADPASGYWVVGGFAWGAGAAIDVAPSQLSTATFHSGSGTDHLWVRASDGIAWGDWKDFNVIAPVDHAPVVTTFNFTTFRTDSIHVAGPLYTVTDADNDTMTAYQLWDSTADPTSGHFAMGGVAQPAGQAIDVTPSQMANTVFVAGYGMDHLWVRAFDGLLWSDWQDFYAGAPADHAPVITTYGFTTLRDQSIFMSALFGVTDPDNDAITAYQFWDSTADPTSGHFVISGVTQPAGQAIDASPSTNITFLTGYGTDHLWVRAYDGLLWSDWADFYVNAPSNRAPVVTGIDRSPSHNQSLAATSLFSVTDADLHATVTAYQLWDSTADSASGYWVVGGAPQPAGQAIDVTPSQLASTTFQSRSGTDHLWARANDGLLWSDWTSFYVNAPIDQTPVVTGSDTSVVLNSSSAVSGLFHATDPDGDVITTYELWDSASTASSAHLLLNGAIQPSGQGIFIDAAQLNQASFVASSTPVTDRLWERAFDGELWSDWTAINVTSHAVIGP
jgi:hypothetical protein